ncbi:AAA family ATPase [Candidatus Riflebacteria bacterium]
MIFNFFKKVSEAPTRPGEKKRKEKFDIADLYEGPASISDKDTAKKIPLDEKLRQAYFWVVNQAIISPYYDIEYNDSPPASFQFGDQKSNLILPSDQSYSSFVLLPLLNLVVRRRCLLIGGPGRGKTASAILMGVLAGYPLKEVKRAIQHGQPQMTITDLLGNPLPRDLVDAASMEDIQISWRRWLGMRVKIIDEYNRIPTRTQSALLTVMADNYAEVLDHIYECPEGAWYLTANDDAGGGTYQVIEALRDRIDVVVKALHFSPRFLKDLLLRIEEGIRPEEVVPKDIIFTEKEIDQISKDILEVSLPDPLRRRLEFFASHFEFCENAAAQFEYKTKDTVKLSGLDFQNVLADETGRDKIKDLGSQSKNGLSVRALMTCLVYLKAMAYFRGDTEVSLTDMRQIMPFVFHDKLQPNHDSPFFDAPPNQILRIDRIGWIRKLFDLSCAEFNRLDLDREDPVMTLTIEFEKGLDNLKEGEVKKRLARIEQLLREWSKGRKVYGHIYDDILKLKYFHQRYTNYLRWLLWKD